jgi:antirestriction protein ArdC
MNVVLLALGSPYASPWWLTYKQAADRGGHVKQGEKASLVTFWKLGEHQPAEDRAEGQGSRRVPILRYYHVFNAEQCEGIQTPEPDFKPNEHERISWCEQILAGMPLRPEILRDRRQAFYSPTLDHVGMPDLSQFETAESYYATLFHELVHSTGHISRLNRATLSASPAPFGSPDYSKEELVAEFGAAFLCGHAGIFPRVAENSAAYIDGWLRVLKQDKRLLPIAASQAQRAADYILNAAPAAEPDEA